MLEGTDVVIHLSGENLLGERWTPEFKKRTQSSRVESRARLAPVLGALTHKPRLLLSSSAIGIYGERGDEILHEDSTVGKGYLSELPSMGGCHASCPARGNPSVAYSDWCRARS